VGVITLPAVALRLGHRDGAAVLYHLIVLVPLNFGGLYALLRAARGHAPRVGDLFEAFRSAYAQTILTHVLFVALVGAGLVLLVVPGIIIATRLSFVAFLVMDEHLDAGPALRESWRRTLGYGGTIFLVWLLGIPISLAGALLFGVGLIPAGIWIHLAFATLFALVTAAERGEVAPVVSEVAG
jgi:uncharacterized membrane protein